MADHVGLDLTQPHALVRQRARRVAFVIEIGGVRLVDEDLQRNAELLAVVQNTGMRVGDTPRPDVDILTVIEGADLTLATVDLGMFAAFADGPGQSADPIARLEN